MLVLSLCASWCYCCFIFRFVYDVPSLHLFIFLVENSPWQNTLKTIQRTFSFFFSFSCAIMQCNLVSFIITAEWIKTQIETHSDHSIRHEWRCFSGCKMVLTQNCHSNCQIMPSVMFIFFLCLSSSSSALGIYVCCIKIESKLLVDAVWRGRANTRSSARLLVHTD